MAQDTDYNGVYQALLAAQRAMPDVEKTGRNERFSYDYLEDKELTKVARKVLQDHDLVLLQRLQEVEREGTRTYMTWQFTLLHAPSESDLTFLFPSEANDKGDKGTSKNVTMARKDFLRTLLMVPGGAENEADPDGDVVQQKPASTSPDPPDSAFYTSPAPPNSTIIEVTNGLEIGSDGRNTLKDLGFRYQNDSKTWYAELSLSEAKRNEVLDTLSSVGAEYALDVE